MKLTMTETTLFIYDAMGQLIAEYSTQLSQTPKTSYLTNDHLGSSRIQTNAAGRVISRHDYQPFGEEIARSNYGADEIRKKFGGKERDAETDLDLFGARYYSSSFGRFTTTDTLLSSGKIENPQSWNKYAYTHNNPVNLIDILGFYTFGEGATGNSKEAKERREAFAKQHQQLKDALGKHKEGSKEYNKIQKTLDMLGEEGKVGKAGVDVKINFKNLGSSDVARASYKLEFDGKTAKASNYSITININKESKFGAATLAHETQHLVDYKGTFDNMSFNSRTGVSITNNADFNEFEIEDRGYETGQIVARSLGENYERGDNVLYNTSWETNDEATIQSQMSVGRRSHIRQNYASKFNSLQPKKFSQDINNQLRKGRIIP